MQTQKDALKMYSKYADNAYKVMLPPTSPTPEESAELAKIMTDVNTYRGEIATKIVMGTEPLSSFDKAIDQFKKMKIDRAVEIVQAEYDRYNKR
jgi:putative aldouronate transport system substrate-binding protein